MIDEQFEELLVSVKDMGKHMRGEKVPGAVVRDFPEPDVKAIRERTGMSQTRFAFLIGVKPKTLQNWEQGQFIRFHGLIQWLGWLWPFALLVYLMRCLSAARPTKMQA